MSRSWLLSLLCLSILLILSTPPSRAGGALKLNEADTRLLLRDENPRVHLALENGVGKTVQAAIQVDLLDPHSVVIAAANITREVEAGKQKLSVELPLNLRQLKSQEQERLLWYRLRYRMTPDPLLSLEPTSGVISLSEITPDLFEIRIASSTLVREAMRYRVIARAQHPLTNRPAKGVHIEGTVEFEDDDTDLKTTLRASRVTDGEGFAILDFDLPRQIKSDDIDLAIRGSRGQLSVEEHHEIDLLRKPYIFATSDKPLYQPGQVLHARVLIFGPAKRAIGAAPVTLKISDPEQQVLFQSELTTSRFGIASADWPIPVNARLGNYRIEFSTEDEDSAGTIWVKISRYDLPNFTVNVKADRSFYLPHEDAEVEVSAAYLFGQPVKQGQVRVVRETERTWNYRQQAYETKEAETYAGETDANGVFKVSLDLTKAHADLDDDDYERFRDLRYAAYFTDPSTSRIEQRRFDLRITKEPIHVYVVRPQGRYYENAHLPLYFYVSTSYADGTPAQCKVTIGAAGNSARPLLTLHTNRHGLARVDHLEVPASAAEQGELGLTFLARDSQGQTGKHAEDISFRDVIALRVETDKTLYRSGDPVEITVTSSERNLAVMLELATGDGIVLHSQTLRLHDGRATVTLPWSRELVNRLTIVAYTLNGDEDVASGYHSILFPQNRELKLGLQANHKIYRPGDDAQFSFRVRDPQGHSAVSALGVVVVDKAVEERARTDQEFGSNSRVSAGDVLDVMAGGDSIAGLGLRELNRIDLSHPVPEELELTAEVMLNQRQWYSLNVFGGEGYEKNGSSVFGEIIKAELKPLQQALDTSYSATREYPADDSSLQRILAAHGIDYQSLRDAWATPFRASFLADREFDTLSLTSAGPDKRFRTPDDLIVGHFQWPYFRPLGETIDRAVNGYHQRTADFIRDQSTLRAEMRKLGTDIDALRDRWHRPYVFAFEILQNFFVIKVSSMGPNGKVERDFPTDGFTLWNSTIDYFAERRAAIDAALNASLRAMNHEPGNEAELAAALRSAGIILADLRDPWGQRYYATFRQQSFYVDRAKIEVRGNYGEAPKERINLQPVTRRVTVINLQSRGADGKEGTVDDFIAGSFSATLSEQQAGKPFAQSADEPLLFFGATGAIKGVLTDPNQASIPGAKIEATRAFDPTTFETISDAEGKYLLRNLPAGLYSVHFSAPGFQSLVVDQVAVHSSSLVVVDASLSPAMASETVTVTATASSYDNTESASLGMSVKRVTMFNGGKQQAATPRLREYFPETLVWQPALETDNQGRAQLNFKLADNITTWKLAVIGSTEDGQIGTVEKEFKSFQPFFVEHDPPRILTEGDEISLPVVVRNYLEHAQSVQLAIRPEPWFTLLGASQKRAEVATGEATRETFDFRASASVTDGKQRITAVGSDDSDAIEKPVTVHPDGEEKSITSGNIVRDTATLKLDLPATAIPGSTQAELKIYPNLLAHLSESVEAIMKRPYGCGEQTISSTYPSLLLLSQKRTGQHSNLQARAERYLHEGYSRLLNYQAESGGFTYWGRGEPDLALTAYALRFLSDARELLAVDDDVIVRTRTWLLKQQKEDGSWAAYNYGQRVENRRQTALLSAYIARVLARSALEPKTAKATDKSNTSGAPELKRALDYLAARSAEMDEPYLLASYLLAAADARERAGAGSAQARLFRQIHNEGDSSYWALETNTPFYGWGLAGRIETTALVVQALTKGCRADNQNPRSDLTPAPPQGGTCDQQMINRGLLFLLRQKDRFGVWHSSQATINVLDALLAVMGQEQNADGISNDQPAAEIIVNGRSAKSVAMPPAGRLGGPIIVDLSNLLESGPNRIEIRRAQGAAPASAQAVASYYVPWVSSNAGDVSNYRPGSASGLRLLTRFDQTQGGLSSTFSCHVEAERVGFHGYGMLLAEIGLPPGAEVDRASLESAIKNSDWAINQYDVLPDRIVVYLWPRAGGVSFDFKFRLRFGLNAKTAPSSIYDYYNPEARALVPPTKFVVN